MADRVAAEAGVSTGVPGLDHVLGGLYWGDNVVWQVDGVSADPFYRAILSLRDTFDASRWVAIGRETSRLVTDFPDLERTGTAPGSPVIEPAELLREIRRSCEPGRRNLLLFDSLDHMVAAWGAELTRGFFARCCPLLLDVGAIAYWSMDPRTLPGSIQETVEALTQCVLRVDKHSVRVAKAEGRGLSVRGSLLHWHPEAQRPVLTDAEALGRVAASLRALRSSRKITQQRLAQMAGVTPSAISQAERAERGLSLTTLMRLSSKLELTLDDLVHGEGPSTYRIGRRIEDPHLGPDPVLTLFGDVESDVHIDLVHLAAREAGVPADTREGQGIVAVSHGLVQIQVLDQTPVIRDGEVLLAERSRITGWRNLADREAVLFWIVMTPHG